MRSTRLKTYNGERAILPNGDVYTSSILVRTAYLKRRLKFVVGIGTPTPLKKPVPLFIRCWKASRGCCRIPAPGCTSQNWRGRR